MVSILGAEFEKISYQKGDFIYKRGQNPTGLYIVDEGELLLTVHMENEWPRIVETLLPGVMVGEMELFSGRTRICNLVCSTDAKVWYLSKSSYEKISKLYPEITLKFVTKIAISFDSVRLYNTVYHWAQLR
jgi:SulP family sulfate permease